MELLLVFAANGAMARDCKAFYNLLADMVAEKRHITTSAATNVIRTKISFSLVRSTLWCIRGSRPKSRNMDICDLSNQAYP